MILVISTCKQKLSEFEFVKPVLNVLNNFEECRVISYKELKEMEKEELKSFSKVVVSGTALKDFDYLNYSKSFNFLKSYDKPVLAICAGLQLVSKVFGIKLKNKKMIGAKEVEIIKKNPLIEEKKIRAYFLTSKLPKIEKENKSVEAIALSEGEVVFFRINNIFASAFHPEVLNKEILRNFALLKSNN